MLKIKRRWGQENTRETTIQTTISIRVLSTFPTLSIFQIKIGTNFRLVQHASAAKRQIAQATDGSLSSIKKHRVK